MAIPLATTTVTVKGKRPQSAVDPDAEGYDPVPPPADNTLATGVRANITLPSGTRSSTDADDVTVYAFKCDPIDVDVTRFDAIVDEVTGIEYQVSTVAHSHPQAFGLNHITGRLYVSKGLKSEGGWQRCPCLRLRVQCVAGCV